LQIIDNSKACSRILIIASCALVLHGLGYFGFSLQAGIA